MRFRTTAAVSLAFALCASGAFGQTAPDLAGGIRQVDEGDFEGAVVTLDAVVVALGGKPGQTLPLSRAHLYLGIAYVALGQDVKARSQFKEALRIDGALRLTRDRHSPKVVDAFEQARAELQRDRGKPQGSRVGPVVVAGVLGAGATAVVLVAKGGDQGAGGVQFSGARFANTVIECPNGSENVPIDAAILLQATNGDDASVTITAVTSTLVIETTSFPSEIGFSSGRPSVASPSSLPRGQTTVRVDTTLLCGNGEGDPPRFNEWSGRITLTTSAGIVTLATADRLRVNVP